MKLIIKNNYSDVSAWTAQHIADAINNHKGDRPFVLGLPTGSSPLGTYQKLIEMNKAGQVSFKNVVTFNMDEYVGLPREHDQSYWYFMHENLFNHVDVRPDAVHVPNGENPDAEAACSEYDAIIKAVGGVDLQLLGIGHDGHIGFNEPADHFPVGTHCVDLTEETIEANKRFFASRDDVPRQAYTMGVGTIMNARKVLLIASGKDKAEIIKKSFFGPVTPEVPASILQMHPDFTLVADEAALSLI